MKLILFSLISVLFVLALVDTKPCTGSRCKRMTNLIAKLYNDYGYGYSQGYGSGSSYNQNGQEYGGGTPYGQGYNPKSESDCPNCYASIGYSGVNKNIVNIDKN